MVASLQFDRDLIKQKDRLKREGKPIADIEKAIMVYETWIEERAEADKKKLIKVFDLERFKKKS